MSDVIVSSDVMAFMRGRRSFIAGEPCPPDIWSDAEWRGKCNDEMIFRLGWMVERSAEFFAERRSKEYQEALRLWAEEGKSLPQFPK